MRHVELARWMRKRKNGPFGNDGESERGTRTSRTERHTHTHGGGGGGDVHITCTIHYQ